MQPMTTEQAKSIIHQACASNPETARAVLERRMREDAAFRLAVMQYSHECINSMMHYGCSGMTEQ